ncbi:hypothetical protein GP486_006016 [Trichoglossum hirsutum]|uniref:14-3-3 domain-containing protein n=1 Tax=Trichoglossum hirsutum TaxID=265104 RepID=A0A9P8L854_9PEZI|nr:hypothetical protein GP486_006016 [Trichoglossum hirsutum]
MATLDVDQKFLGQFAKNLDYHNPFVAAFLFKILGLSVNLSKPLLRARRLRKLDITRDTKSLGLYHHIIWLSREGLVMLEDWVLPEVAEYAELRVLAYKLKASFYHIFVLFHNDPRTNQIVVPTYSRPPGIASPQMNGHAVGDSKGKAPVRDPPGLGSSSPERLMNGGPVGGSLPPGLAPVSIPKPTGSFLLPAKDYIPTASNCFAEAAHLADRLLPGSHPLRLSVKLEYCAFLFDCVKDYDGARRLAKLAIADVYNAEEGIDDEMFEDASQLVRILGRMARRGLPSATPSSTPGMGSSSTVGTRSTPVMGAGAIPAATPSPGMENPI